MIEIKYNIRNLVDKRDNRVVVRVRWNNKRNEVGFTTGFYAQQEKWDIDQQKAKKGTTHQIVGRCATATEINRCLSEFKESIAACFQYFAYHNSVPTSNQLKEFVNKDLNRNEKEIVVADTMPQKETMEQMLEHFLDRCGKEKNWDYKCKEKYEQAYQHIMAANPGIKPDSITIEHMLKLRDWYVEHEYKNRTINKQLIMLKAFLKWINQQEGYDVPSSVLNFSSNLKVLKKTVTYLKYEELLHFAHFKFENDDSGRLTRARDAWCFMAFTSLRVSDLMRLKKGHIQDKYIDMYAQKTGERLLIPLIDESKRILSQYMRNVKTGETIFNIPSPQKLNNAVKDAAKSAGLNREIIDIYLIGNERKEDVHRFHEIISNHDARRTFVSCSLAMGISAETVMKCTGHHSYNTMKPYIETAIETQVLEMEKWNRSQYRSQIVNLLDNASEEELKEFLFNIQRILDTH